MVFIARMVAMKLASHPQLFYNYPARYDDAMVAIRGFLQGRRESEFISLKLG